VQPERVRELLTSFCGGFFLLAFGRKADIFLALLGAANDLARDGITWFHCGNFNDHSQILAAIPFNEDVVTGRHLEGRKIRR
jgi:hypothetical protein